MPGLSSYMGAGFSVETSAGNLSQIHQLGQSAPGTQVNIAFLGNETFEQRLHAVATIAESGLEPVPILSARRIQSAEALESFLIRANGLTRVKTVFLVGGDPVAPQGPFADSLALIHSPILGRCVPEKVVIAGYPEGHPRIRDDTLWECLQHKVAHLESKGLDVEITTQLAFDAEAVVAWIERVRRSGIQSLIRIGVPAPATMVGLMQFAAQCRVTTALVSLQKHGWPTSSMPERASPENFLVNLRRYLDRRLLNNIALHIFPLGDLPLAVQWFQTFYGKPAARSAVT